MKLRIHEQNLMLVRDCLNGGYPEVWLHGDGNVFKVYTFDPLNLGDQDHSGNHAKNYNNGHEENGYRVKINRTNMPKSVKDAELMLMRSKQLEEAEKDSKKQNVNARVTNIRTSDAPLGEDTFEPAGVIDYTKYAKK